MLEPEHGQGKLRIHWKLVVLGLLFMFVLVQIIVYDLDRYLNPDMVRTTLLHHTKWAPILLISLNTVRPLTLLPASTLSIPAGMVFGPFLGGMYTVFGVLAGGSVAFGLARYLGREYVERIYKKRLNGRFKSFDRLQREEGFKTILFCQLFPVIPFDIVNYGGGLSKVRYRDYLLATALGVLPGSFAFAYLGCSLTDLRSGRFVYALLIIGLLSVTPFVYQWWISRKRKQVHQSNLDKEEEERIG